MKKKKKKKKKKSPKFEIQGFIISAMDDIGFRVSKTWTIWKLGSQTVKEILC